MVYYRVVHNIRLNRRDLGKLMLNHWLMKLDKFAYPV
jgi:hypothetical protein